MIISYWNVQAYYPAVKKKLIAKGIPIIDEIVGDPSRREEYIEEYLREHEVSSYILLDDDIRPNSVDMKDRHIIPSYYDRGLTKKHVGEAVLKLKKKM